MRFIYKKKILFIATNKTYLETIPRYQLLRTVYLTNYKLFYAKFTETCRFLDHFTHFVNIDDSVPSTNAVFSGLKCIKAKIDSYLTQFDLDKAY